jgi:hypothetical protein
MPSIKMFAIIASSATAPVPSVAQRQLSMTCVQSLDKLQSIFEEYRTVNYSQELPTRFRKDIIRAASTSTSSRQLSISATSSKKALISVEGIESVLKNIGQDHRISRTELEGVLREVGGAAQSGEPERFFISPEQMIELISVRNAE